MRAFGIELPTWEAWADVVLKEAEEGFEAPYRVTPPYGPENPLEFDDPVAALLNIRRKMEHGEPFFVLWGTLKQEGELHQIASISVRRYESYFIEEEQDTVFGTTVHSLWSFSSQDDFAECVRRLAADLRCSRVRFYDLASTFDLFSKGTRTIDEMVGRGSE